MIFARRHEQDLAEIHALTQELDQRAREGLERLRDIRETQDQLAGRSSTPTAPATGAATSPPAQDSVELTSEEQKRGGGIGGTLRQLVYGPDIELAPSEADEPGLGRAPQDQPQVSPVIDEDGGGPLAFVHIPKTAGGTVTSMFAAAYSKAEVHKAGNYMRGPEKTLRKVANWHQQGGQVSVGHVPYSMFRERLPEDTRYMTFLREPVDRVLSHYYRHVHIEDPKRASNHVAEPWSPDQPTRIKAASIEQALVEIRAPQLSNLATRFLGGGRSPMGELPASALEDAKENLRTFAFIGIQERFDESLVLLKRMLGLGDIPYMDRHVSSDRPAVEDIPDEQRALIAEYNRLDAELYSFGLGLFENAVAGADEAFASDVQALRARSADEREEEWREAALGSTSTKTADPTSPSQ